MIYLNEWTCMSDMLNDFTDYKTALPDMSGLNIILASYGMDNYSGDAFVLFRKGGKLFEVNGSHCSCFGLEGQWEPEEVSVDDLKHRVKNGSLGVDSWSNNNFRDQLIDVLQKLED
jgi:hypothetical protein